MLKVSVTAVPEDGKANAALVDLLAKTLHIAKRSITIASGATDRRKVLLIEGDSSALQSRFADWVREK
jgi:hypothetical protein